MHMIDLTYVLHQIACQATSEGGHTDTSSHLRLDRETGARMALRTRPRSDWARPSRRLPCLSMRFVIRYVHMCTCIVDCLCVHRCCLQHRTRRLACGKCPPTRRRRLDSASRVPTVDQRVCVHAHVCHVDHSLRTHRYGGCRTDEC